MEPVSNVGQLVETLRKQLVESQQKTGTAGKAAATSKAGPGATRPGVEELQRKVRERLRHIDSSDPQALHKSIHVFLESVLLWEFGDSLMTDPKFHALLDDVQRSMESDPRTRNQLSALIAQLQ